LLSGDLRCFPHQPLKGVHVLEIIQWCVDWRLGNERCVGQSRIIQQTFEWSKTDTSLPDVLVSVELRAAGGFGIIAMPYMNVVQADCSVEPLDGIGVSIFADDVVAGDVGVAGIDAGSDWNVFCQ